MDSGSDAGAEGAREGRAHAAARAGPPPGGPLRRRDDGEFLLFIKTRAREFEAVRETIQKMNTYELPEVLAYRVHGASPAFASWIAKATERPKKRPRAKKPAPRRAAAAR